MAKCKACGVIIPSKGGARVARMCIPGYALKNKEIVLGTMCLPCIREWDRAFISKHSISVYNRDKEFHKEYIHKKIENIKSSR